MLVYNKTFDLFHTIFRLLQLTEAKRSILEIDKLRILDFYLVFPSEMLEIKSFRGFKRYETLLENEKNTYERILDRKRVFFKMENIQLSAMRALVSYGLFDAEEFKAGKILRTGKSLPDNLLHKIDEANTKDKELLSLIVDRLAAMDLYGHLGLKERTNLIEFKYDAI